jgi:hypothetical protein
MPTRGLVPLLQQRGDFRPDEGDVRLFSALPEDAGKRYQALIQQEFTHKFDHIYNQR